MRRNKEELAKMRRAGRVVAEMHAKTRDAIKPGVTTMQLNNIAADKDRPLVIVVNDNTRSYAPTSGGLADHLATLRTTRAARGRNTTAIASTTLMACGPSMVMISIARIRAGNDMKPSISRINTSSTRPP